MCHFSQNGSDQRLEIGAVGWRPFVRVTGLYDTLYGIRQDRISSGRELIVKTFGTLSEPFLFRVAGRDDDGGGGEVDDDF